MKYRHRTFYSDKQKSQMWDRWERGEWLKRTGTHAMKFAFCLAIIAAFASPILADQPIGVTAVNVVDDEHNRPLSLSAWYPGEGGVREEVAANAVFEGVFAGRDASLLKRKLPTVLLSHGGLRSADDSGAWLASTLAQAGFFVVEVNAPRASTASEAVDEIWRRPQDVSRALDEVLRVSELSNHIDLERISAVGFALGGTASLALAGDEFDVPAFVASCDEPDSGPDCAWFAAQNVGLNSVDREALANSWRDSRITKIVAISPEYLDALSNRPAEVDTPTLLISLGGQQMSPVVSDTRIVKADIPYATIFDGFASCKPAGPKILSDDGGDTALCGVSAEERNRAHTAIAEEILRFFNESS